MEWVNVEDDGCRWVLDLEGGPFAVLPCDVCSSPVEISTDEVRCPRCGTHTPPGFLRPPAGRSRNLEPDGEPPMKPKPKKLKSQPALKPAGESPSLDQ